MNKRGFLKAIGIGALAMAAGMGFKGGDSPHTFNELRLEERLSPANKELLDFPTKLPGAREVKKYMTPGAKYVLTHVRDHHDVDEALRTSKRTRQYIDVQNDIYSSLNYLVENQGLTEVYLEGLDPKDERLQYLNIKTGEEDIIPASNRLAYLGKLKIKGCESNELNHIGIDAQERIEKGENIDPGVAWDAIFEDREDFALKTISESLDKLGRPLAVMVYGCNHAWGGYESCGKEYFEMAEVAKERSTVKDNIHEWNKLHPDKKFSLIEVTPESL